MEMTVTKTNRFAGKNRNVGDSMTVPRPRDQRLLTALGWATQAGAATTQVRTATKGKAAKASKADVKSAGKRPRARVAAEDPNPAEPSPTTVPAPGTPPTKPPPGSLPTPSPGNPAEPPQPTVPPPVDSKGMTSEVTPKPPPPAGPPAPAPDETPQPEPKTGIERGTYGRRDMRVTG